MDITHKLYFKFSPRLIDFLAEKNITANQLSIFNIFLMLFGICGLLSMGNYWINWLALCLIAVSVIIDYADGDLARKTNTLSKAGLWLDSYSDIIMQNSIMGAIALGNFKYGIPLFYIILFFISNSTLNLVSLKFNDTFGFDSYKGNGLFRKYMDEKSNTINIFFKGLIDPTSNKTSLFFYTVRYWIILGIIFNKLNWIFIIITLLACFRAVIMYTIYTLYLLDYKKLWVMQALRILDENREEFYNARMGISKTV
ncbi:MAG: CDP-alcohol phosphatidyltransferase family protein [Candidatus Omnitrophota bacterium]